MALARGKIIKANNEEPDENEKQISQALLDLEINSDLKVPSSISYSYSGKAVVTIQIAR